MQSHAGQLPEMGRHLIDQFMRKDPALPTPLTAAGIGDTQDIAAGPGAGQPPAVFAIAEPVSAFALQQRDELRTTDKPGAFRLRCACHGGSHEGAEAQCQEPTHAAVREAGVMSFHIGVLAVVFLDSTRCRSELIKLVAWLKRRVVLSFQHGVHQGVEGRGSGIQVRGRKESGFPLAGQGNRGNGLALTFLCPEIVVDQCRPVVARLQEIGRAPCHSQKRDEIVEAFRIRQRSRNKVRTSAVIGGNLDILGLRGCKEGLQCGAIVGVAGQQGLAVYEQFIQRLVA
ncbi:unnamed protein product [Stenotrophomonas maltophilia]|nr:unnamed protein product [Stenotrophomonas maltophilia]